MFVHKPQESCFTLLSEKKKKSNLFQMSENLRGYAVQKLFFKAHFSFYHFLLFWVFWVVFWFCFFLGGGQGFVNKYET